MSQITRVPVAKSKANGRAGVGSPAPAAETVRAVLFTDDIAAAPVKDLLDSMGSFTHLATSLRTSVFSSAFLAGAAASSTSSAHAALFRPANERSYSSGAALRDSGFVHRFTSHIPTSRAELAQLTAGRYAESACAARWLQLACVCMVARETRSVLRVRGANVITALSWFFLLASAYSTTCSHRDAATGGHNVSRNLHGRFARGNQGLLPAVPCFWWLSDDQAENTCVV